MRDHGVRWFAAEPEVQSQSMLSRLQEQARLAAAKVRAAVTPPKASKGALAKVASASTSGRSPAVIEHAKRLVAEPLAQVSRTANKYRDAVGLQVEAFWRRNYLFIFAAGGVVLVGLLWRVMYGVTSTFISVSEAMAKFGFLALSAALVILTGLYLQHRFTISPDAVYRLAMRRLQTDAGVLEVLGAPLSGSDVRAYVMSGGNLRFRSFRPRFASRRCFLIFPVRGSERRGLVSAEVKKKEGKHNFKLLAVDVPTVAGVDAGPGRDQRLYVVGDAGAYESSGGVISELRNPIVRAMAKQHDYEVEDDREAEQEARERREREEREAQAAEEAAERAALAARAKSNETPVAG